MIADVACHKRGLHDPGTDLPPKSRFCGPGMVSLVPRMPAVDRVAERIVRDEHLGIFPVVVEKLAEPMRMLRLMSMRLVVTSSPSTTMHRG